MTSPAPLTPPDPAEEPTPATEEAADRVLQAPRYGRRGIAADLVQGLRYVTATPLVMSTFCLDAASEVFREASALVSRLSHRIEGGPR